MMSAAVAVAWAAWAVATAAVARAVASRVAMAPWAALAGMMAV